MKASEKHKEQTIASERFSPALNAEYQELFQLLIRRLRDTLPTNRARIIRNEFQRLNNNIENNNLEAKKYLAALNVLIDLSVQGWIFDFHDDSLYLKMENDSQQ